MVALNARAALAALSLTLLSCSNPIRTQTLARVGATPLSKLALVTAGVARNFRSDGSIEPKLAAQIVTGRVLQALYDLRTFEVVPPGEVASVLSASPGLDPLGSNVRLNGTFGVQAVLRGTVSRFQQRLGGPRGASRPAAVAFMLELSGADGLVIWRGNYEEVQQSLSDDPGSFSRARARSFRWVTAETLASYGARELVMEMPGPSASWK
jgi:hypothetical protein